LEGDANHQLGQRVLLEEKLGDLSRRDGERVVDGMDDMHVLAARRRLIVANAVALVHAVARVARGDILGREDVRTEGRRRQRRPAATDVGHAVAPRFLHDDLCRQVYISRFASPPCTTCLPPWPTRCATRCSCRHRAAFSLYSCNTPPYVFDGMPT